MFCARCGGFVGHDDSFCGKCGMPVNGGLTDTLAQPPASRPRSPASVWVTIAVVLAVGLGVAAGVVLTRRSSDTAKPAAAVTSSTPPSTTVTSRSASTTPSSTPSPSPSPSPSTLTLAQLYARQQSGVVRIETLACGEGGQRVGTGFLLSPTLIATVDHVIADSTVISLIAGTQHATGQVVGHDPARDLALVKSSEPLAGFVFHFSSADPQVGDQVAAVGFPVADPITLTQGNISGLDRAVDVEGNHQTGMLETDAAINPGNSGGPLMEQDGSVIGLVDALDTEANGIAYAVPASQAAPAMSRWTSTPVPLDAARCDNPTGPSEDESALDSIPGLPDDVGSSVATTLNTYFNAINDADYQTAWSTFSDRRQARVSVAGLARGDATSIDFNQTVITAQMTGDGSADVALSFVSLQDADHSPGSSGDVCDVWSLIYKMTLASDGSWRIDNTKPYRQPGYARC